MNRVALQPELNGRLQCRVDVRDEVRHEAIAVRQAVRHRVTSERPRVVGRQVARRGKVAGEHVEAVGRPRVQLQAPQVVLAQLRCDPDQVEDAVEACSLREVGAESSAVRWVVRSPRENVGLALPAQDAGRLDVRDLLRQGLLQSTLLWPWRDSTEWNPADDPCVATRITATKRSETEARASLLLAALA